MANAPSNKDFLELSRTVFINGDIENTNADSLKKLAAAQNELLSIEINKNASRLDTRALFTQGHFAQTNKALLLAQSKTQLQTFANALDRATNRGIKKANKNDLTPGPTKKNGPSAT